MGEIISGIGSYIGSNQAAHASQKAAANEMQMYGTTRSDLAPYNWTGQNALAQASNIAGGTDPTAIGPDYVSMAGGMLPGGPMTQANLEATPGYQFTLGQGLKAVRSAAAARGLGMSGASLKGAANYATGLADQTFQQQFQNLLTLNTAQQGNLQNRFGRLNTLATLGENAAAQTGQQGTLLATAAGNATANAGALQGAGTAGLAKGVGSAANDLLGYGLLTQQQGTSGYG